MSQEPGESVSKYIKHDNIENTNPLVTNMPMVAELQGPLY